MLRCGDHQSSPWYLSFTSWWLSLRMVPESVTARNELFWMAAIRIQHHWLGECRDGKSSWALGEEINWRIWHWIHQQAWTFLLGWMRIGCLYPSHTTRIRFSWFFFLRTLWATSDVVLQCVFWGINGSRSSRMIFLQYPSMIIELYIWDCPGLQDRPKNTAWHSPRWKASISQVRAASRGRIPSDLISIGPKSHGEQHSRTLLCGQWDDKFFKPSWRLRLKLQRSLGAWAYFLILSWFMQSIILVSSTTTWGFAWVACWAYFVWLFCSAEDSW